MMWKTEHRVLDNLFLNECCFSNIFPDEWLSNGVVDY